MTRSQAMKPAAEPEIAMKVGSMNVRMLGISIECHPSLGQPKLNSTKVGSGEKQVILGHLFWRPSREHSDGS